MPPTGKVWLRDQDTSRGCCASHTLRRSLPAAVATADASPAAPEKKKRKKKTGNEARYHAWLPRREERVAESWWGQRISRTTRAHKVSRVTTPPPDLMKAPHTHLSSTWSAVQPTPTRAVHGQRYDPQPADLRIAPQARPVEVSGGRERRRDQLWLPQEPGAVRRGGRGTGKGPTHPIDKRCTTHTGAAQGSHGQGRGLPI